MKTAGFTLIETLVYMAISTLVCTSLIAFSVMLFEAQAATTTKIQTELDNTYQLQISLYNK